MPRGLGFYNGGLSISSERSALRDVGIRVRGAGLAAIALTAIQRLAAAAGHSVAIPPPVSTARRSGTDDMIAIVAFTIGAALIILAWTASLRARPPGLLRRKATSA